MKPRWPCGWRESPGSPPARGRGLKPPGRHQQGHERPSPPARGRGLKPRHPGKCPALHSVAPRAGAWIETHRSAPRSNGRWSPPARGRGLKRLRPQRHRHRCESPPARGRGLKQRGWRNPDACQWSPPARGRGLKLPGRSRCRRLRRSPPARGRGLKPRIESIHTTDYGVAPRAGAWIETENIKQLIPSAGRRPPRGGVD